jgi:radical SAM protein with 4Fe4S-binding SPASM domain
MSETKKSFDGGQSQNIYFVNEYEKDFAEAKGVERWTAYRRAWEAYCSLEREETFVPHLEFELNYSCNLRCPMCTWAVEKFSDRKKDWMPFESFERILAEAVASGTKSVRLCYVNEPLIRSDIDQFVRRCAELGVVDILITSNGTLLTKAMSRKLIEAGLTKLNVSLDAVTAETYDKIRVGGDFNKTLANIEDFLEIRLEMGRKLPKLRVTFCRTKLNEHEHQAFIDYWKDKADSLGIQNAMNPFAEGRFKDDSRKDLFFLEGHKPPAKYRCQEPFKRMTVRGNGDVIGCCSLGATNLVVGDWRRNTLTEIWNGEKMRELRRMHKSGEYYRNPICKACVENISFLGAD